jgi:hypothetical protein
MALIIPQNGFGSQLGTAVGTGLGQGLQDLAQMQLQQMQQRRQMQQQQSQQEQQRELVSQGLGALFSQQQAQALAGLPPDLLKEVLKQQLPQLGEVQVGSELESILTGAPQVPPDQQKPLQQLLAPQEQQATQQIAQLEPQQLQVQPQPSVTQVSRPAVPRVAPKKLAPGAQAEQQLERLEETLARPGLTASQQTKLRDRVEKRNKDLRAEQEKIDSFTKGYFKDITEQAEAARTGGMRLDRMEELVETGQLPSTGTASLVDALATGIPILGIGLDVSGTLYTPEAQEFKKLSKDFLRDVKKFFGARVTQQEVNQFLQTIPNLLQSDEGKLRVIRNMRIFHKTAEIKNDIASEIIEANNGFRPKNLQQLVEKKAKPQLDIWGKVFKSDLRTNRAIKKRKEEDEKELRRRRDEEEKARRRTSR